MKRLSRMALVVSLFVGLAWSARAQSEASEEVTAAAPPPTAEVAPPPAEVIEEVPDGEKADKAAEHISRMKEILSRVLKHLEDAREERDVIKLNCVNEKLTAVKGLLRISEQADVAMQEALARRNSEVAEHEYEKTAIAVSKCEQLFAESEACVGEMAVYAGDTEIEVEITGEPPEDLTDEDADAGIIVRPPAASPYQ